MLAFRKTTVFITTDFCRMYSYYFLTYVNVSTVAREAYAISSFEMTQGEIFRVKL